MSSRRIALAVTVAALPTSALAQPLDAARVLVDASALQKVLIVVLAAAMLAAVVIAVRKLAPGKALAGGSAFVSGLRLGGPIIGALGAAYAVTNMAIGAANVAVPPTLKVLAPGVAEAGMMLWLGCLAGAVAVIANWAIESRIDRQVLA